MPKIYITQEPTDKNHIDYIDRVLRNIRLDHLEQIILITQQEYKDTNYYLNNNIREKIKQKLSNSSDKDYLYRYGANDIVSYASKYLLLNNKKVITIKPVIGGKIPYEECFVTETFEEFLN